MMYTWTCQTHGPDQTEALGRIVGGFTQAGDLIALVGELGAGKTQFTRGLAHGVGVDGDKVSSPTFVFIHEYPGGYDKPTLLHMDAYRVGSLEELESIGWDPAAGGGELRQQSILVVEWADRLGGTLGDDLLEITFEHLSPTHREVTMHLQGQWRGRASKLLEALNAYVHGSPQVQTVVTRRELAPRNTTEAAAS
jgi:tRNA threonylcarbamoyladenosine biosynthesis protein TsaE